MVKNRQKLKMSGKEFFSKSDFEFFPSLSSENFQKDFLIQIQIYSGEKI